MKRNILHITVALTVVALIVLSVSGQVAGQSRQREIKIYWLQYDNNENPTGLVEAKRQVDAASPLKGAFAHLLSNSPTDNEERNGQRRFILGFEDFSVGLKGGTARINLTTEYGFEWGEPMRTFFVDAVEKTARQFPEVKKVTICVDGRLDYMRTDRVKGKKC